VTECCPRLRSETSLPKSFRKGSRIFRLGRSRTPGTGEEALGTGEAEGQGAKGQHCGSQERDGERGAHGGRLLFGIGGWDPPLMTAGIMPCAWGYSRA